MILCFRTHSYASCPTAPQAAGDAKQAAWRQKLLSERIESATAKREGFRQIISERDQKMWSDGLKQREAHLKALSQRFVDPETSAVVESSEYEQVSNAHIAQGGSQVSTGSAAAGGGRGPWSPSAKSSGWFASWWSGPEIKQTTI